LTEESQAKLKEIHSFLQRDIQDQVRDANLLEEVLESINQDLPVDINASLEPLSQLVDHFAVVKQALKKQSSQPSLEQKRATGKQFVKDSYAQTQKTRNC
jgi:Cu/Ag efflux pump CusA